ncbi:hypothetical protein CHUAL_003608 [Chamberlinius hualienensis]
MSSSLANSLIKSCGSLLRRSTGLPSSQSRRRVSYRAAILSELGAPLTIKDVNAPSKLARDELRIKVHACGVNFSDILICQGEYRQIKLPFTPGFEVAGTVLEVGKNVQNFKTGDRIVTLNKEKNGGFAEQCVAHEKDVFSLPPELDYIKAASLVDCYATAYLGLVRRANIEPEQTLLVTAAAGGLGLAAVDLAANVYQAKVIGVCGHEKEDLVREKGAWAALSYNRKDIATVVNDVTDGKGVNVMFDAVGGDLFLNCLENVAHEGEVIVAGFASRQIPQIPTNLLLPRAFALIGVSLSHYRDANLEVYREIIEETIAMGGQGLVEPHVSATFKIDQINEAFQYLLERKSTGKVVLTIGN